MTLIIEIESTKLNVKTGVSQRTQKPYEIREQNALMFKEGERFPDKIKVTIRDGQSAYAPGRYTLHDDSFYPSRFGGLEVNPVLVALPAVKQVSNG